MTQDKTTDTKTSGIPVVPKWFLAIVSVPIIIGLLWFGRDFLIPLALASLLFILNIALIERLNSATVFGRDIPRWVAYIGVTAGLFILLSVFGYALSNQATAVAEAGPRYAERLTSLETQFETLIGSGWVSTIEKSIRSLDIGSWLTGFAASTVGVIGNIGLILLYVVFMLGERGAFAKKLPRLCATPDSARQVEEILKSISAGVRQYIWINTATSAMSGTLAFVVMTALGVDFALPLALLVFLLNFIPSIGSFLAVVFPTIVALLQFETITPALMVVFLPENLLAFDKRFIQICRIARSSPRNFGIPFGRLTLKVWFFSCIFRPSKRVQSSMTLTSETTSSATRCLPASMRDRSRMSLISLSR